MATMEGPRITLVSNADLSADANIGRGISLTGTGLGQIGVVDGADFVGVLLDGGLAAGDNISVQVGGVVRARAGGDIDEGDQCTLDASGEFVQVDAINEGVCLIAIQSASAPALFDAKIADGQPSASGAA